MIVLIGLPRVFAEGHCHGYDNIRISYISKAVDCGGKSDIAGD